MKEKTDPRLVADLCLAAAGPIRLFAALSVNMRQLLGSWKQNGQYCENEVKPG